jgi:hypothetical protein
MIILQFALQLIFIALIVADLITTYRIIDSGKGVEIGPIAKYYMADPAAAIVITMLSVAFLLAWLAWVQLTWFLIPCILRIGWLVRKNLRILKNG